jgi:hypothetical protein
VLVGILGFITSPVPPHSLVRATIISSSFLGFTFPPYSSSYSSSRVGSRPSHTMARPQQFPYLYLLNLLDLTKLSNDPIFHNPAWPAMPTKLPSDIPKVEGKSAEDPTNHVMNFHLWCSSNSIIDDYVCLNLFQITLTSQYVK